MLIECGGIVQDVLGAWTDALGHHSFSDSTGIFYFQEEVYL